MERCDNQSKMCLGGGFKHFDFHPYLGKWSQLTNIFQMDSNGLKPPTLGSEMTTRNLFFWKLDLQGEVRSIGEMCSKRLYVWPLFRGRFPFFGKKSTSFQEDGRSYCKLVVDLGDFFLRIRPWYITVFHHHLGNMCCISPPNQQNLRLREDFSFWVGFLQIGWKPRVRSAISGVEFCLQALLLAKLGASLATEVSHVYHQVGNKFYLYLQQYRVMGGFKYVLCFHLYLGKVVQFDEHIFQMGWNQQLEYVYLVLMSP